MTAWLSILASGLFGCVSLEAQSVTLPTSRFFVSPEQQLLTQTISAMATRYYGTDSAKPDTDKARMLFDSTAQLVRTPLVKRDSVTPALNDTTKVPPGAKTKVPLSAGDSLRPYRFALVLDRLSLSGLAQSALDSLRRSVLGLSFGAAHGLAANAMLHLIGEERRQVLLKQLIVPTDATPPKDTSAAAKADAATCPARVLEVSGHSERYDGVDTTLQSVCLPVRERDTWLLVEPYYDATKQAAVKSGLDSLAQVARATVIRRKLQTQWRFPVRNREQALAFWNQQPFSALNIGAISGNANQGAAYTELASPFLQAVRVSVSAVVTVSKDSTPSSTTPGNGPAPSSATIDRFLNGGGLLNIGMAFPLANKTWNWAWPFQVNAMVLAAPRVGGTVPVLGASQRDTTLLWDSGVEVHLQSVDPGDGVGLFAQFRGAISGGTARFNELIGIPPQQRNFRYSSFGAGLLLANRYVITVMRAVQGPRSVQALGWQVSVTAMRSAVAQTPSSNSKTP